MLDRVAGHDRAKSELHERLYPVVLLLGQPYTGKKTLARALQHVHAGPLDRLWCPAPLTVDAVAKAQTFAYSAPRGACKVVVLPLDGASRPVLVQLLKLLEEPPATVRFILTAAACPATILSRAMVYRSGFLTDEQVEQALVFHGFDPLQAAKAAALGAGQVRPALDAGQQSRQRVVQALKAVAAGDRWLTESALKHWDAASHQFLFTWCREAASGHWRVFKPGDGGELGPVFATRLVAKLSAVDGARPRLAALAALESMIGMRN